MNTAVHTSTSVHRCRDDIACTSAIRLTTLSRGRCREGHGQPALLGQHLRRPRQRTPADNQTVRNVFVIGPDKKIKLMLVYPMTTGRNYDEVLRAIDSHQLAQAGAAGS
jgi:hypothetical protein